MSGEGITLLENKPDPNIIASFKMSISPADKASKTLGTLVVTAKNTREQ